MKKLNIFLMGALALGMAACDDDTTYGIPQVTEQEPIATYQGVTVSYDAAYAAATLLDMADYVDKDIKVFDPAATAVSAEANLPAKYMFDYELALADNQDMNNATILPLNGQGAVSGNDWEAACMEYFGKSPLVEKMWTGIIAYVSYNNPTSGLTQRSRLGDADFYFLKHGVDVKPLDLNLDVEMNYYFVTDGQNANQGVKMDHSASHPYNDPSFSYVFDVTTVPFYWNIASQSQYDQNLTAYEIYGPAGTGAGDALAGALATDGNQGIINTPGTYKVTANMLDKKYEITLAYEELYTPGGANGWSFDNNFLLTTNNYKDYVGLVYVKGEFKLTAGAGWGTNWGATDGKLVPGGDNIKVDKDGLYYVNANLSEMTVETMPITKIALIGGFNGWDTENEVAMTPNADGTKYTATVTFPEADSEYLFRLNGDWSYKIGQKDGVYVYGGDNIKQAAAGTFEVTLECGTAPMKVTFAAK